MVLHSRNKLLSLLEKINRSRPPLLPRQTITPGNDNKTQDVEIIIK